MRVRESEDVMSVEGHYGIRAGHTNNKYYNTDGGQRVSPRPSTIMQHIVIHVALMTVLLLRKSFIAVLGRATSTATIICTLFALMPCSRRQIALPTDRRKSPYDAKHISGNIAHNTLTTISEFLRTTILEILDTNI